MLIKDFTQKDIGNAKKLALENYNEERSAIPFLPVIENIPDLSDFANNGLGVAMYEGDTMLGYLCGLKHEKFRQIRVFSPEYAHGAVKESREKIYGRLYQAASKKWVERKALIHAIMLYSHDAEAKQSLFNNVFGACVMYAAMDIRSGVSIAKSSNDGLVLCELNSERYDEIMPLQNKLLSHLRQAPVFLPYEKISPEQFCGFKNKRYFAALDDNKVVAYLRTQENAEPLVTHDKGTVNITGAYMFPKYRGSGIYTGLLSYVVEAMRSEGYKRISVDFETYNPNALRFWTRYFTPYTTSLTRSIEPLILETNDFD